MNIFIKQKQNKQKNKTIGQMTVCNVSKVVLTQKIIAHSSSSLDLGEIISAYTVLVNVQFGSVL